MPARERYPHVAVWGDAQAVAPVAELNAMFDEIDLLQEERARGLDITFTITPASASDATAAVLRMSPQAWKWAELIAFVMWAVIVLVILAVRAVIA